MRMFYTIIQCFILGNIKQYKFLDTNKIRICYRCKVEDKTMTAFCLNCKKAIYCNRKCMNKNRRIHDILCKIHTDKQNQIKSLVGQMDTNFNFFINETNRINQRRKNDNSNNNTNLDLLR